MHETSTLEASEASAPRPARDWIEILQRYRHPDPARSTWEVVITAVPFVLFWAAAWAAYQVNYLLALALCIPAGAFLVRLFLIQHDCGHGAFFKKRATNDWVGRVIGVFTLTAYDVWRRNHAMHHASSGDLDERGTGDINTLTVAEYRALPLWRRIAYRLYRNPIVMFGFGPAYVFMVRHRLPRETFVMGRQAWISVMATNLAIALSAALMIWLVGWQAFFSIHLPIVAVAASIGVWLFYVQHQFEDTFWDQKPNWTVHEAALYGSSHYDLPGFLPWLTAHIGIHHVHHLYSRIPYYRLPQVLRDFPELGDIRRITLWESFSCVKLTLWDESRRRLVSFREALA